ncbi:MAG: hypothetical protein LBT79_06535, partial [Elusimicrobiota bacterium]|nr:hypothetical protein [Elusimicrobiota bacterium]
MKDVKKFFKALFFAMSFLFFSSFAFATAISNWSVLNANYLSGADFVFNISADITFTAALSNNPSWAQLTIQSDNGSLKTLDGNQKRGFVFAGKKVNMTNLIFTNFITSTYYDVGVCGGALRIISNSIISFDDSSAKFIRNGISNRDSVGYGGAISIEDSQMNFNNSIVSFIDNSSNNIDDGYGGAIDSYYGGISFNNSIVDFINNNALGGCNSLGGAIYSDGKSAISFSNSIVNFIDNAASDGSREGNGGAIFIEREGNISFNNSTVSFTDNYASGYSYAYGGAISADKSAVSFSNSIVSFIDNSAGGGYGYGGAISAKTNSAISFSSSIVSFIGNETYDYGGAIYARESSIISFDNSTITFSDNFVYYGYGQAIYIDDSASRVYFNNSTIIFAPSGNYNNPYDISMIYANNVSAKTVYFNRGSLVFSSYTTTIKLINSAAAIDFNPDTVGFEYSSGAIITDFFFSPFSYMTMIDISSNIKFNISAISNSSNANG